MAGTAVTCRRENATGSEVWNLRKELNKVITDLELLRAAIDGIADKLDADAAITLTTYASGAAVATASTMTAATVNSAKL
jgi:hypothetical protein